ncbi:MAG: SDR family oxidoreductase [Desulfovibrionaceae bacterium]|nr:SDR family oxidoreductase [Desulfovibrionaceae bacterium]
MNIRFDGKAAFVTGAAMGIGWACARMFAEAGASVMLADLSETVMERAEELRSLGFAAQGTVCDVSEEEEVARAVDAAMAAFGRLDCACNNAGIHAAVRRPMAETEGSDFDRVIGVNLRGIWNCLKHEIPAMLGSGGGAIVNCSSQGGLAGIPSISAYTASKHGVVGLTRTAALDYARRGVRINCVCPGTCATPMVEHACAVSPGHMARVIDAIPLGRMGRAEEIAGMELFLCSDYAGFAIGQTWAMDGGYTVM